MPTGNTTASRPAKLIGGAVIALAVLAGLGALLDLGPFATEELPQYQFIARADGICRKAHAQFEDLQSPPPETSVQAQALTEQLIAIAEDEYNKIADLEPPGSISDQVDDYLAARAEGIDLMHQGLDAARDNDGVAYERAQSELESGQGERRQAARAIGLDVCSEPLSVGA